MLAKGRSYIKMWAFFMLPPFLKIKNNFEIRKFLLDSKERKTFE